MKKKMPSLTLLISLQLQREVALAQRHTRQGQVLTEHTKVLKPLRVGDQVLVQNQTGLRHKKWDKSGVIVEILDFDQHRVRMDGSGRVTLRNRRFLRVITPYQTTIPINPAVSQSTPASPPSEPPTPAPASAVTDDQSKSQPQTAQVKMRRSERLGLR